MNAPNPEPGPTALPAYLEPVLIPEGASFKVAGLGGVGGPICRYLAVFLASQGRGSRLFGIDGDSFEATNQSRMLFRSPGNKAEGLVRELQPYFQHTNLALFAVAEYLRPENIARLVRDQDCVFLAVDNHATRKLVSDHCQTLRDVTLISAGNDGVGSEGGVPRRGTYANVQVYVRRDGRDLTPPLTHLHPEILTPEDRPPTAPHCTDLVASVPQILFTNLAAASLALNAFLLLISGTTSTGDAGMGGGGAPGRWSDGLGALHYSEIGVDIAEGLMRPILPAGVGRTEGDPVGSATTPHSAAYPGH